MDMQDEKKLKEDLLSAVSGGIRWDDWITCLRGRDADLAADKAAGKQQIKSLFHEGDEVSGSKLSAADIENIHRYIDDHWDK